MRIPLLLAAALLAQPAAAQLYKCMQDGKVVYQDSPCVQGATQSTIRLPAPIEPAPPPPAGEKPPTAGAAAAPTVDVEGVVRILAGFQSCANDLDGYASKHNAAYQAWRTRNQAAISQYNQDPEAQKRVRANLAAALVDRPRDATALAGRTAACDQDAESWFSAAPRAAQ